MRLLQHLFESKNHKLVIFPGGFHPWTNGHTSVYEYLRDKFPTADLYVASSNKMSERPFSFNEKRFLAAQAGVPADKFIEVKSPYKSTEITEKYDSTKTVLIFGLSSKDKDRLGTPIKKNGDLAYMQPFPTSSATPLKTFNEHAYYVVTPAINYKILGQNINSASKIREMYTNGSESDRYRIIQELYPKSSKVIEIKEILDRVLLTPTSKLDEHIVKLKNGKYRLLSHVGKNLGTFDSHAAAAKHEGEVEYFKHLKESTLTCYDCKGEGYIHGFKTVNANGVPHKVSSGHFCSRCKGKGTISEPVDFKKLAAHDME